MEKSQTLTKESSNRLMRAIDIASRETQLGMDPNVAIVKAAQAVSLPRGHIDLLVQMYNTGATLDSHQTGTTPQEKAAEFPLAAADRVRTAMYPDTVKTASQQFHDVAVSDDYSSSAMVKLSRLLPKKELRPLPRTVPQTFYKAAESKVDAVSMRQTLEHKRADARRALSDSRDHFIGSLASIREYLCQADAPAIQDLEKSATVLFGSAGQQIMAQVKQAVAQPRSTKVRGYVPGGIYDPPFTLIKMAIDAAIDLHEKKQAYERRELAVNAGYEARKPIDPAGPRSVLSGELTKSANFLTRLASLQLSDAMSRARTAAGGPQDAVSKFTAELDDPSHEANLRAIRTQTMLADLVRNDPVLSSYAPGQITNSFNEIAQLSPRSLDQPLIMRAMLRKHLEQGVFDPFEADQLLKLETQLLRRDMGATAKAPIGGTP